MLAKQVSERGGRERGEVLIESALAFPFILSILLGLGQQFAVVSKKLEHVSLATEVMLGPQDSALSFDKSTAQFAPLGDATTPTLTEFLDTIGAFAQSRAGSQTSVWLALGYLKIDPATGVQTSVEIPTVFNRYGPEDAPECGQDIWSGKLETYAAAQLRTMNRYSYSEGGQRIGVGSKVYDITVGGTQYKGYVDYLPFVFMLVCSEPVMGLWSQTPESVFTVVPRRLVS